MSYEQRVGKMKCKAKEGMGSVGHQVEEDGGVGDIPSDPGFEGSGGKVVGVGVGILEFGIG